MRLVIFGVGGMGREALRHARLSYSNIVFADDNPEGPVFGIPVIDPSEIGYDDELLVAIGNSAGRRRVIERYPDVKLASVFAATSTIGTDDVDIGAGALFCDNTLVTASVRIGRNFQCNAFSYIGHDCVVGNDVTFGPRVSCNGNVHIRDGAQFGAGANIRNGCPGRPLVIGEGAFISMGALVTRDVPEGARVIGNRTRQVCVDEMPLPSVG
jgi:sugar O-acyltransferase (sialic acid O-acetyltransferase NeuD family)